MRDYVLLYINGVRHEVRGKQAAYTLSDYLRYERNLKGTKVVCAEGDCGACTVLVGQVKHIEGDKLTYRPVNSCIALVANLDCSHIITVEGLKSPDGSLNPVQEKMITEQGSQCGFCTPGFVTAMSSLMDYRVNTGKEITRQKIQNGLTGNLCRCTGYESIIDSALAIDTKQWKGLDPSYPMDEIIKVIKSEFKDSLSIDCEGHVYQAPKNLTHALKAKADNPDIKMVAGASDLGVQINKRGLDRSLLLSLSHIEELNKIEISSDHVRIGANVNLHEFSEKLCDVYPDFCNMIDIFASPQIKNRATIIGNVANASPVADSIPFLMAIDATLIIQSTDGPREVSINNFYQGYKTFDLKSSEIITHIKIPKLAKNEFIKLFKVSVRKDMDISAVTFAAHTKVNDKKIDSIRLCYGGVGPVVLRMPEIEKKLKGRAFEKKSFSDLDDLIDSGMTPMSDVRGSDRFRYTVSKNLMQKFYFESQSIVEGL